MSKVIPDMDLESRKCEAYVQAASGEERFEAWLSAQVALPALLLAEGFEERSLGLLRLIAKHRRRVPFLGLARYIGEEDLNLEYRQEFEKLAEEIAPGRWRVFENRRDGAWLEEYMRSAPTDQLLLDISGLTTRGLFAALDAMRTARRSVIVGYSEAGAYRPTQTEWNELVHAIAGGIDEESLLAEKVDEAPWLFGGTHLVRLLPGHEGYDAGGVNALLAFLPFKPVRLGSLLAEQQYSSYVYVAGCPRLPQNAWRLDALKRMNGAVIKEGRIVEVATFGYRDALRSLAREVCGPNGLLNEFDVHLAPMGSKLQNLACWILSCLVPPLTVITTVPGTWHTANYSHGIGESWVFPLKMPGPEKGTSQTNARASI